MTRRALIGHTGFVGSNLASQTDFEDKFNSKNFREMAGQQFDMVVCAGIQAVKWWANQNPEADWEGITPLLDVLDTVSADRFILISTVDVYKTPRAVDEETQIETDGLHAYGLHRYQVEQRIKARFPHALIVRLPGLFGPGLKKNLIFDVLNGRDISGFDAESAFQFYDLTRLASDLDIASQADGVELINFATAPVRVADVVERISGKPYTHRTENPAVAYDMHSKHSDLWGLTGPYIQDAPSCLDAIAAYAETAK